MHPAYAPDSGTVQLQVPLLFGSVSCYMAFMWTIPLVWVLWGCTGSAEPSFPELIQGGASALLVQHNTTCCNTEYHLSSCLTLKVAGFAA